MKRFLLLCCMLCCMPSCMLSPLALGAQASPTVDPLARVYRDLEQLAAMGLIDSLIMGQRPFSEREVVRLLRIAQRGLAARPSAWAERVVTGDIARYARNENRPIDRLDVQQSLMDSPDRPAPIDSSGAIDARINPLAAYRGGRPLVDGATTILESRHAYVAGPHAAFWASPIVSVAAQRAGETTAKVGLQSGGARFEFGNFVAQLARDYEVFAQSADAATVLSTNAPALDAITLTNDRPAKLPFFRWLGPVRGTLFVADLGPHQYFPHSALAAWKVSMLPHPNVEVGVHVESESGGDGAPRASLLDRAVDLFPSVNGLRNFIHNGSGNTNFSNKFAGLDLRVRVPAAWGLDMYGDGSVDDFDTRRLASSLFQDGGYVIGFRLSCITECGRVGVRAEYQQTGIRYYTHGGFRSGFAMNGEILGDALGPRGLGGYVTTDVDTDHYGTWGIQGAYEVRSGNLYAGGSADTVNARDFKFVQIAHRPGEHRARVTLSWMPSARDARLSWFGRFGAEQVTNFAFVEGRSRTNVLAQVGAELRP